MAGLATQETNKSVDAFIESIENESKRADATTLLKLMKEITGKEPKVWGDNFIVAFGKYKYTRKGSNTEYEWFNVGLAPRKSNLTIYLTYDISKEIALLEKFGKATWGKGCLYIKTLKDIDMAVLKQLIEKSKDSGWY